MKGCVTRFCLGLVVLAFLAGGGRTAKADTIVIDVESNFFSPFEVFIATGDTICWFFDTGIHTTTSSDGLWDSGILGPGSMFDYTFNTAGNYGYICTLHFDCCDMEGIIHVVDPVILNGLLSPSGPDPDAIGTASYEMVPYRTTLSVAVQGVTSTNAVDVFVNGNFLGTIGLDPNGNGELDLNTDNGDMIPALQNGDEIEVYDAVDDVTLILIGNVSSGG